MKKVVGIICIIAVLLIAGIVGKEVCFDYPSMEKEAGASDVEAVSGYTQEGNTFLQASEDPNFMIPVRAWKTNMVTVNFAEKLEENLNIQIYYATKIKDFNEASSVRTVLEAGESQYQIGIPTGDYTKLRFDIDGSFSLDTIQISAHHRELNYIKLVLYCVVVAVLLVLVWKYVYLVPGWYQKYSGKLYDFGSSHGVRQERFFLIAALLFGIAFSFLLPPEQVPDEWNHFNLMEMEFGTAGYLDEIDKFYENIGSGNLPGNASAQIDMDLLKEHAGDRFSKEGKSWGMPQILCVRHLPCGIGFYFGVLIGAPILVCLQLAELCSAIFYAVVGYFALKILPIKKELFCAVMLLPITLQQCSSINYDSVLLPVSFFLLAYIIHCIYEKDKVGWKQVIIMMLLLVYIVLLKPPYALFAAFILLIPKEKWDLKIGKKFDLAVFIRKYFIVCVLAGVIVVALGGYVARNSQYIKTIAACFLDFPQYMKVLWGTLRTNGGFYVKSAIGVFGCLDTYATTGYYVLAILALVLFSQSDISTREKKVRIYKKDRAAYLLVSVAIIVLVITIMFTWSFFLRGYDASVGIQGYVDYMNALSVGDGVQGRYYIPIIPLCLLCIHGIVKLKKEDLMVLQLVYYPVIIFWSTQVLLNRFWF